MVRRRGMGRYLDDDLVFQSVGRGQTIFFAVHRSYQQHLWREEEEEEEEEEWSNGFLNGECTSKDISECFGHELLLCDITVLLYREEDWEVRGHESVVSDCMNHIHELDLCGEGSPMIDDGLPFWSIPAVH